MEIKKFIDKISYGSLGRLMLDFFDGNQDKLNAVLQRQALILTIFHADAQYQQGTGLNILISTPTRELKDILEDLISDKINKGKRSEEIIRKDFKSLRLEAETQVNEQINLPRALDNLPVLLRIGNLVDAKAIEALLIARAAASIGMLIDSIKDENKVGLISERGKNLDEVFAEKKSFSTTIFSPQTTIIEPSIAYKQVNAALNFIEIIAAAIRKEPELAGEQKIAKALAAAEKIVIKALAIANQELINAKGKDGKINGLNKEFGKKTAAFAKAFKAKHSHKLGKIDLSEQFGIVVAVTTEIAELLPARAHGEFLGFVEMPQPNQTAYTPLTK
jgi:hypothetical protein